MIRKLSLGPLLCAAVLMSSATVHTQTGATNGEWRHYGGDLGSTKYSPLTQVDATNFNDLQIAWRWQSADGLLDLDTLLAELPEISIRGFQATPLMVGGVLYISTSLQQVAAIDAGTGETIWTYNPEAYRRALPLHSSKSRGVAYWADGDDQRIFYGTDEGYLLAVDARTGQLVQSFGDNGRVDLMEGVPRATRDEVNYRGRTVLGIQSPPIVARGVIVTPTITSDYVVKKESVPGWLKGVDARTGETKWVFRTVPQADDFGVDTWLNDSWRYAGNANVWSMLSVDDELGYVYLPTGSAFQRLLRRPPAGRQSVCREPRGARHRDG